MLQAQTRTNSPFCITSFASLYPEFGNSSRSQEATTCRPDSGLGSTAERQAPSGALLPVTLPFSRMPQPQLQRTNLNSATERSTNSLNNSIHQASAEREFSTLTIPQSKTPVISCFAVENSKFSRAIAAVTLNTLQDQSAVSNDLQYERGRNGSRHRAQCLSGRCAGIPVHRRRAAESID